MYFRTRLASGGALSLVVIVLTALAACGADEESTAFAPPASDAIVPTATEGIVLARSETPVVAIQTSDEEEIGVRVQLSDDYNLLATYDVSRDLSEPDKQIIVVKRREDPSDRVRLLVAKFDPLRNAFRITWEGETYATGVRSFSVQTMDVVGDHQDEIVGIGVDSDGNQTTNVFRREPAENAASDLSYYQIFGETADGSIEIVEERRSDGYRTLQSSGVSFPIVTYSRDTASDDSLDLIRSEFRWSADREQYVLVSTAEISRGEVEQEQLRTLYDADADAVEAFLQGPWFKATGQEAGNAIELAHFNPAGGVLTLYQQDAQERYEWVNSYKTLYEGGPGLWVNLRNQVLRTVRKQMSITVLGTDSIRIAVDGAEYWNGRYQRMTSGIQESVIRRYEVGRPEFSLQGVFRNENDEELLFEEPRFRFRTNRFDWGGGYNVIDLGQPVLELKVVDAEGDALIDGLHRVPGQNGSFNARYAMDYSEQRSEDRIVRRLVLRPVRLTVDGIESVGGEPITLEQVEEFLIGD